MSWPAASSACRRAAAFSYTHLDVYKRQVYHYEGGIIEFVRYLNKNKEVLFPDPIYMEGVIKGTTVEVALQYNCLLYTSRCV